MRKSKLKQTLSMLLAVLMVFMSMNFSVFAEELNTQQTEQEIMTNDLAVPAVEDPPAETSTGIEEQQAPALLSNDLPAPAANGAAEDEASLRAAIDAAKEGDVIDVGSYIELTSPLMINKAVTLRGSDMFGTIITKSADSWTANGDKSSGSLIVVADVEGAVNIENMTVTGATDIALTNDGTAYGHGIDVYRSKDVTLKNVFSTANSGAGLIVNGSTVTTQYLMTADNGWYSVNVDNSGAVLNLSSDSVLGDAIQIKSDHGGVTVNASGYENYTYIGADNQPAQLWSNVPITNTAYTVSGNVKTLYTSLTAAIQAVKSGETVYLAPGTYDETVKPFPNPAHDQEKSVNIVGAADEGAPVKGESVLTQGMFIGYDDSKTRGNTISVKGITFENIGLTVADEKTVTVENNKFYNVADNAIAVLDQLGDKCGETAAGGSVIVKNNIIDGAGAAGINLRNPYDAEVTGNSIANVNENGILFQLAKVSNGANYKAHKGKVTVTNNTITNWDANNDSDGGRAIRIDTQGIDGPSPKGKNFTITGNKFTKEDYSALTVDQNIVKITGVGENTVDLTNNYWNSDSPAFDTILSVFTDAGSNKAPSSQVRVYPFKKANGEDGNAPISVKYGETTTQYASLAEAVAAAPEGATVTIKEDITVDAAAGGAIQVTKPMTITADANKKITTKGTGSVKLFNIAAAGVAQDKPVILKGLNIELADDTAAELHVIQVTTPYTTIQDCNFTGKYTAGSSNVTRAICTNAGNENLTVNDCTFTSIRQPGYFEGKGELKNNTVTGTKGFVMTAESDYTMTDNHFSENAVDIAIIPNNQSATNYDAGKLSAANNGAVVENQIDRTLAQSGTFVVDPDLAQKVAGDNAALYTLQNAVNGVKDENSTVKVAAGTYKLDSKLNITKPLTLEGVGAVIITKGETPWTSTGDGSDAMLINIVKANGVTLKNLTVTGAENIMDNQTKKASGSGINVSEGAKVTLENITSTDNAACGVIVNSSTVTATDLNTSGNVWGGVNVDKKTDNNAEFNLSGNSTLSETNPIYSEKSAPDVTVDAKTAEGTPYVATKFGSVTVWSVSMELADKVYTIDDNQIATIYASIEEAVKVLNNGGTIYLGESTDDNSFTIGYDVTLPDNITIQGTGEKASIISLDYNGSNGSGSNSNSGTFITGKDTKFKNITFNVTKPNRTGSSATFSVYKSGFAMEDCTVNVAEGVNDDYYIFDTNALPFNADVSITGSSFTSKAKMWTVYSGDISKQKTLEGKLTFTGNTITGDFAFVLDQITGAYDISNNNASLTADDACLTGLSVVGSSWSNIDYGSVISGNTLTTKNTHATDALIRILPIRPGSKIQALPAVMQTGFVPTVENNTFGNLPMYDVNMKRVNNNLCTLRLQGALTGSAIYTTYDNTAAQGKPYVITDAPIIGKTSGGSSKIYDNLQTAVNEVGSGGTVTIPYTTDGYTYNNDLNIRDGITIEVAKGADNAQGTAKINGQVVVDGAKGVVLNNISIETTTGEAAGAILTKQGAAITVNDGAVVNNSIKTGSCGIRMEGESDSVTLNRANVKAAKYYGISVRNSNQNVTVNESTVTGWAAIMTSNGGSQEPADRNVTITVKDSKLYGYHVSDNTASEGYGTVTLQENFEKVSFTAENTSFYAGVNHDLANVGSDGLYQNALQVRSYGNTINLTNCQFEMENKEARVIHSHINTEGGEPYTEKAEATDDNKNTFAISGLELVNPGSTEKKMIDARARFGGVKQDEFTFTGTNDLNEADIEWNRLAATGNTIQIGSAEELTWVVEQVNSGEDTFAGKTITLTSNIDLSSIENWTPIGIDDSQKAFAGTFDGGSHTISGLKVDTAASFAGLFGAVNGGATIKDLTIDNAQIKTTGKNAGVLIGGTTYANQNSLTIENVNITNSQVEALGRVGGVIGWIKDSIKPVSISGCRVNGSAISGINDATGDEGDKVGGIAGVALGKTTITGCNVGDTAETTITGCRDVGGIIGLIGLGQSASTIEQCNIGKSAKINLKFINPIDTFAQRDINVGVGGIVGTYLGKNALTLTNNVVDNATEITADLTKYTAKSNIEVYKGRYFGAPRDIKESIATLTCDTANNAEITFYGKEDAAESGVVLKDIIENRAQAGDTVNLAEGDYTSAEAITIGKALTINGLGESNPVTAETKPKAVINSELQANANITLDNLSIISDNKAGAVIVRDQAAAVIINCYAKQTVAGTSGFENYGKTIVFEGHTDTTTEEDSISGCYVDVPEGREHGVTIDGNNRNVKVNSTVIQGVKNKDYNKGIVLNGKNINLTIDGTAIDTWGYAFDTEKADNCGLTIQNKSDIKGYAALSFYQATNNTDITIKDATLTGRNVSTISADKYGVIVAEACSNLKIKIDNTKINAISAVTEPEKVQSENIILFNGGNNGINVRVDSVPIVKQALSSIIVDNSATNEMIGFGTSGGDNNDNCTVTINPDTSIFFGSDPAYRIISGENVFKNAVRNINSGMSTAVSGDTLVVPSVSEVSDNWTLASGVNLLVNNDITFTGRVDGSSAIGGCKLTIANGKTVIFTTDDPIPNFFSVAVKDYDSVTPTMVKAKVDTTDDNSFVGSNMTMKVSLEGRNRVWTANHPTDRFDKGNGTKAYPFMIATPEQLAVLAQKIEEDESYTSAATSIKYIDAWYQLSADITVGSWTPIGKIKAFNGHFDGNGYTIEGNGSTSPLFGSISNNAIVEKLTVKGTFPQMVKDNQGTIENCSAIFMHTETSVVADTNSGSIKNTFTNSTSGLVNAEEGTLTNSYYEGNQTKGNTYTREDMQKARFANTLNCDVEGVWDYNATAASETAYPFVMKDGGTTTIQPVKVTITPEKNSGAIGYAERIALAPAEKIYANDDVKVKATLIDTEHYVFDSWTVNDVKVDVRTAEATIKVKDAETVIHANFIDKPKVMVNVSPQGAGSIYLSLNDGPEQKLTTSTYIQQIYVGSKVTVRAEGYNIPNVFTTVFRYWIDASTGQKLSSDLTYTINSIGSPRVIQAVFEEKEQDSYKVQFNDINGNELNSGFYKTADTINVPAAPILSGYEFVKWTGSDGTEIAKDTKTITGIKADTSYRATYKAVPIKYTISVTDGTINGQSSVETEQRTNVTAVANAAPEGKVFVGWQEVVSGTPTGVYLSYSESYTFQAIRNMTIQAIYEDNKPVETVRVILDPTPVITKTSEIPELYRAGFIMQLSVPEGYTVIETGLIYKNEAVADINELVFEGQNVIKLAASKVYTSQFSRAVKDLHPNSIVTGRGYAILSNGSIVYSENMTKAEIN